MDEPFLASPALFYNPLTYYHFFSNTLYVLGSFVSPQMLRMIYTEYFESLMAYGIGSETIGL